MKPYDFFVMFLAFVYSLGLTHLLFAATRMIRHRRRVTFSWPHALWMLSALCLMFNNWLSLWDLHTLGTLSLGTITLGFVTVMIQYAICALVSPDLESEDDFDLRRFHDREGPTYLSAFLLITLLALGMNLAAASQLGVQSWAGQNGIVIAMIVPIVAALLVKTRWVQTVAALTMLVLQLAYPIIYYQSLG